MFNPQHQPLFEQVEVQGQAFFWTCAQGLDAEVVDTVEGYIKKLAYHLKVPALMEGLTVEDLIQEGRMGALMAAERYKPGKGSSFLGYAKRWIYQRMADALDHGHVAIPERQRAALRRAGELPSVASLDQPLPSGDGCLGDLVPDVSAPEGEAAGAAAQLHPYVDQLPERERFVIRRHYGLDGNPAASLAEVGKAMGLGSERVRQLHIAALRRLKKAVKA